MTTKALNKLQEKADRLVKEGRVTVHWTNGRFLDAAGMGTVVGDHGTYRASFTPGMRVCTCKAGRTLRDCSHALALEWFIWQGHHDPLQLSLEVIE